MAKKTKKTEPVSLAKAEILRQGMMSPFWSLIVEVMNESIADIEEKQEATEMGDMPPEQYKLVNELFKAKKEMIRKLIDTPKNVTSWLERPEAKMTEFDPYMKPEDVL